MRKLSYLLLILLNLFVFSGCEKDYQSSNIEEITTPVSFSNQIVPILIEDCATNASCHIANAQPPDLTAANAYLALEAYVDTANAQSSILYQRIIASVKPMPPNGKLNAAEIAYILAWIKQGAQNN